MSPNFSQLRKLVLRCGSVFYGHIAGITSSEPHYIILLNDKPITDDSFVLVVASSRVERVGFLRRQFGANTIAEIELGTEDFLPKPTYINCNDVKLLEVKYIKEKYDCRQLKCLDSSMSEGNLKQIISCVRNSRVVSEEKKNLLPKN